LNNKGQGANQALLDALSLARILYQKVLAGAAGEKKEQHQSSEVDILNDTLDLYEEEMLSRSSVKVEASAKAAHFLHTDDVLLEGNVTRGAALNHTTS